MRVPRGTSVFAASKPVDRVPRVLRHALHLYFGQPSQPSPQKGVLYTKALMEIIGRLSRTRQYLAQREIAIADISDMPVAMCAQVAAMNFVSMLMKRNPLEFKGYVWSGLLEQAQVALSQSSVDPIAKPVLGGAIHLELEDFKAATMMREQTLTLIHEAMHKFGGTVDHQYFPDDSMLQKYEAKALKLSAKSHLSGQQLAPDDPGTEAQARQKLEQDPKDEDGAAERRDEAAAGSAARRRQLRAPRDGHRRVLLGHARTWPAPTSATAAPGSRGGAASPRQRASNSCHCARTVTAFASFTCP